MDLLPGFAWPVPRAFASAVAACRFEQGDVFYDAPGGYARWPKRGPKGVSRWVQVLDPPGTARSAPADAEGNRFTSNWIAPVTALVVRAGEGASGPVRCTQGRIFSCLWRGLPGLLEAATGDDPPMPLAGRELQKQLDRAAPVAREALGDGERVIFVSVVDESSEASLAKRRAVESALAARYEAESVSLAPADAGVPDGEDYHPALRIRASAVAGAEPDAVRELLKRALYAPTRSGGDSGADRFKLERHGLLLAGDAPDDEAG